MKRVGKSSPLLQYVTFSAVFHNVQEMKTCFPACDRKPDLTQLDRRAHIPVNIFNKFTEYIHYQVKDIYLQSHYH